MVQCTDQSLQTHSIYQYSTHFHLKARKEVVVIQFYHLKFHLAQPGLDFSVGGESESH